jgi:hypothetical protein
MDDEFALGNMIPNPVKNHVDGFGVPLLDSTVRNASGTGVIYKPRSSTRSKYDIIQKIV